MCSRERNALALGFGLVLSGIVLALASMFPASSPRKSVVLEDLRTGIGEYKFNIQGIGGTIAIVSLSEVPIEYSLKSAKTTVSSGSETDVTLNVSPGKYVLSLRGDLYELRVEEYVCEYPYAVLSIPSFIIVFSGAILSFKAGVALIAKNRGVERNGYTESRKG